MEAKVLPLVKEKYPQENPRLKLLDLCDEYPQKEVAEHLGVSESAISKMVKRIKINRAKYN